MSFSVIYMGNFVYIFSVGSADWLHPKAGNIASLCNFLHLTLFQNFLYDPHIIFCGFFISYLYTNTVMPIKEDTHT